MHGDLAFGNVSSNPLISSMILLWQCPVSGSHACLWSCNERTEHYSAFLGAEDVGEGCLVWDEGEVSLARCHVDRARAYYVVSWTPHLQLWGLFKEGRNQDCISL